MNNPLEDYLKSETKMNKNQALEWIVKIKAISPFTRNFIIWLYENGGRVVPPPCRHPSGHRQMTEEELKEYERWCRL